MTDAITAELGKAAAAISAIDPAQIRKAADIIRDAFRNGNQVIFCGNGGSSADAQHIAAEFSGRYMMERPALPGVCLSNIAPVTAIGNDYSYDIVFKRQVEGICRKGDVLVGLSTSGNSKNVILAMEEAKARGGVTIAFTGDCGRMREIADHAVTIPTTETPHVQEGYLCACHIVAGIVERELFGSRAVFIDRDDTVAKNVPYCDDPDKFEVYPDVPEAIARLNRAGYLVIVITNQSGLNRGYFDLATLDAIHSKLRSTVEAGGGRIDDIFRCHPLQAPAHRRGRGRAHRRHLLLPPPAGRELLVPQAGDRHGARRHGQVRHRPVQVVDGRRQRLRHGVRSPSGLPHVPRRRGRIVLRCGGRDSPRAKPRKRVYTPIRVRV